MKGEFDRGDGEIFARIKVLRVVAQRVWVQDGEPATIHLHGFSTNWAVIGAKGT
jgi:hypothetical protein